MFRRSIRRSKILSPQLETKFQSEVSLFSEIPEFPRDERDVSRNLSTATQLYTQKLHLIDLEGR